MNKVLQIAHLLPLTIVLYACDSQDSGDTAIGDDTDIDSDADSDDQTTDGLTWRLHDKIESIIYLKWTQATPSIGYVEYRFDGDEWLQTPQRAFQVGNQEQIVLGVPYDTDTELRLVSIVDSVPLYSETVKATTGGLPLQILQPTVYVAIPELWEQRGKYLLGSINASTPGWQSGEYWLFILDRRGRVVWAYRTPDDYFSYYIRTSRDGNDILWDEITFWTDWDSGENSIVFRMKIDGTILKSYPVPGANHAFTELPGESIVWWGMTEGGHLRILKPNGEQDVLWSCPDFCEENGLKGNCLANTVFWRESTDTFLISFALQDFVVEVDHATGETVKVFGAVPGAWKFDPVNAAFDMNHGVTYTDHGTLLVSTHLNSDSLETIVREYSLDLENEVLREIWNYGIGKGIESPHGGEAHRLPEGNTLHNYGEVPRIKEITPNGDVVWDLGWSEPRLLGRTVFVDDLYAFVP